MRLVASLLPDLIIDIWRLSILAFIIKKKHKDADKKGDYRW